MRRADGVGPIKIGCSRWPEKRLATFQVWSPEVLEIVVSVPGTFDDERNLHCRFSAYRLHSEWFEAAPAVLAVVAKTAATGALPPQMANDRTVRIIARFNSGETMQAIADDYGITRQRIEQILRESGQEKRGHRTGRRAPAWLKLDEVRALAASGRTCGEIAAILGDSMQNVYAASRANGIRLSRPIRELSPSVVAKALIVAADYKDGMNSREIAEKHAIYQPDIYRYLRVAGVIPDRVTRVASPNKREHAA
jgi:hypothetical protein